VSHRAGLLFFESQSPLSCGDNIRHSDLRSSFGNGHSFKEMPQ
jgi:hypothetical protein